MPSRRKRKRERRRAENPALRGDRETPLRRERATLRHDWQNASRSDLHLFRRAIRERWAIPLEHRGPLKDAVVSAFEREGGTVRQSLVACRVVVDLLYYNLELEERVAAYARATTEVEVEVAVAALCKTLGIPKGRKFLKAWLDGVSRSGPSDVALDGPSAGGPPAAPEAPDDAAATPVAPAAATAAEQEARREAEAAERRRLKEQRRQEEEQRRREEEEAERRQAKQRRRQEEEEAARKAAEAARQAEGLRRYHEWAAAKEAACPPSMFRFMGIVPGEAGRW
jgi:hypothetical protein